MAELDQMWLNMLAEASSRAAENGQSDVADYLRLKLANDTIRKMGVDWLFETTIEAAFDIFRGRPGLNIDREEPHTFKVGPANMVGSLVQIRQGVRCVAIEAGWVRTPSDGIMRNGALALARIRHFGMPLADAEFRLVVREPTPVWLDEDGSEVLVDTIKRHLRVFLSE